jgi:hypothetical protein
MGPTVSNPRICSDCEGSPDYRCGTCGCGIQSEICRIPVSNTPKLTLNRCPPKDWNRALVDDELDIVNKAIYGEGNEYDVLATATHENETTSKVCSVTRHSMQRLKPGEWLNDEVINYFLRIYLTRVDKRLGNPTLSRSYICPSFFLLRLLDEANNDKRLRGVYNYNQVGSGEAKM